MIATRIKNSKYRIHGNKHHGRNFKNYTTVTLPLLIIYSTDTMVTVTISSVIVKPNIISPGQNPTLLIFSKKPESQSFPLKIKSEYCLNIICFRLYSGCRYLKGDRLQTLTVCLVYLLK